MSNFIKSFLVCVLFTLFQFIIPNKSLAVNDWIQTNLKIGDGHIIKFAYTNKDIGYATSQNPVTPHIYRTINGGLTWIQADIGIVNSSVADSLAIDYNNPKHVFAGLYNGDVYETFDGFNWIKKSSPGYGIRSLAIDPNNPTTIYAGINGGLYVSTNSGTNWQKVGNGVVLGDIMYISISKTPNSSRIICASSENVYISNNYGVNWDNIDIFATIGTNGAIVIDPGDYNSIYLAAGRGKGLWESADGGINWVNIIENYDPFEIAIQVLNGRKYVFTSSRYTNSGIYKYDTVADTNENITGNLGWAYKWGLDSNNSRLCVFNSIYFEIDGGIWCLEHSTPTPKSKIIFIPGLGGSWNQDALLFDKEVEQSDWEMMPVYTDSYKAFFKTLTNAGLEKNRDFFGFYYDWRKPVEQNGQTFSNYLTTNFPDQEVDVVSHSMGGLVARSCLENIDGCKDKINKFITVGTPHKGAVDAYFLWHGVVTGSDPLAKSLESILLKLKGNNVAKIIPSVRDIMPIFDYISGKPYSQMSQGNKNPFLELLNSANTIPILTTISGNIPDSTSEKLKVVSKKWGDGYPTKVLKGMGDDSVLTSSSKLGGASDYPFSFTHNNLLGANDPQIKILETLELPTDKLVENSVKDNQFRGIWFMYLPTTQNPAVTTMQTTSQTGFNVTCDSQVIQVDTNVFVAIDPTEGNCKVTVPPGNDGRFKVVVGDISDKNTNWKTVKGKGHKGLDRWYHVKYHKNHKCEIFDWLGNKIDNLE